MDDFFELQIASTCDNSIASGDFEATLLRDSDVRFLLDRGSTHLRYIGGKGASVLQLRIGWVDDGLRRLLGKVTLADT